MRNICGGYVWRARRSSKDKEWQLWSNLQPSSAVGCSIKVRCQTSGHLCTVRACLETVQKGWESHALKLDSVSLPLSDNIVLITPWHPSVKYLLTVPNTRFSFYSTQTNPLQSNPIQSKRRYLFTSLANFVTNQQNRPTFIFQLIAFRVWWPFQNGHSNYALC